MSLGRWTGQGTPALPAAGVPSLLLLCSAVAARTGRIAVEQATAEDDVVLTVVNPADPRRLYEFTYDGERRVFGRDPACDIVAAADPVDPRLSARAGLIWRMDGELWLRNISTSHDLYVEVPHRPPEPPLPPRPDQSARGAARSIPGEIATIRGPDDCRLVVRQVRVRDPFAAEASSVEGATTRVPRIPDDLRRTAVALCEPLFEGSQLPATYARIGQRTGNPSRKSVRNQVERLTALYLDEVPALRDLVRERLEREAAQLGLVGTPRVVRGVVHWDIAALRAAEAEEQERRSALALPTYYEVAHLLVRRGLVSPADAAGLVPLPR
jgi:hypothetical protein